MCSKIRVGRNIHSFERINIWVHMCPDAQCYYENGYRMRVGLIWVDGHYYYIKSDGTAVRNQVYWVTRDSPLKPNRTPH